MDPNEAAAAPERAGDDSTAEGGIGRNATRLTWPFSAHRVFSAPPVPAAGEPRPPQPRDPDDASHPEVLRACREHLPYWQKRDPVAPPPPSHELETPGETLNDRQIAFCRAYVECPVAAKAARLAGYSPVSAAKQASKLLKHPAIVRLIYELRDVRGKDHQVRRDTIIDQAEAVFESAMEKGDHHAAMQALAMKARMAGFSDYLPGVRILRREPSAYEQEFWARTHEAEQRLIAIRYGEIAGGPVDPRDVAEAKCEAEARSETAGLAARRIAAERPKSGRKRDGSV